MKQTLRWCQFHLQSITLQVAHFLMKPFIHTETKELWVVVGPEIAGNLRSIGAALDPSVTVCIGKNPHYAHHYNYRIGNHSKLCNILDLTIRAPILFAALLHRASGFFYLGSAGFLRADVDGREREFRLVKQHGKRLVCSFLGTDIRSPRLLLDYAREHDIDVITSYQHLLKPNMLTRTYELQLQRLAATADQLADEIFNAPVDQISYITRQVHPPVYFYPTDQFSRNDGKFDEPNPLRIVHAPSSPIIKGTPLVRAAIKKLKTEGYDFEYIELTGVPNTEVLRTLKQAHIVLNEFYAFVPGQFGVEALAAHCALLTSADEHREPSLPPGSNTAWVVTPYWLVYDHLRYLLDNPHLIKQYADEGYAWAQDNCEFETSRRRLRTILGMSSFVHSSIAL